ncbi:xanthine dehydrogenase small subunit [Candidatus Puniceispirillum sp.]|nr:xanthine dehydrogenase small subunit [Candidatus Puniceispirillum sp.]
MRTEISFVLNGRIHHSSGCAGDMTLLDWLRDQPHLRGTKQGCGEGDCGACTVSIARPDAKGNLVYRPVNACILFMGMVNGAAIRTVEGLSTCGNQLHPVQAAMVENDASQCGFCTPGFVMTLYTAYQNGSGLGPEEVDDTIAGNLCRCTGYRPIVAAAASLNDTGHENSHNDDLDLLLGLDSGQDVCCDKDGSQFMVPATSASFAKLYAEHPDATIIGGATDVGLWVTKQHRKLEKMIWTGGVAGFDAINDDGDFIRINPAVTHQQLLSYVAEDLPQCAELLRRFGALQVRSSGTVCGNIANASPIGDLPPVLISLNGAVELTKGVTSRLVKLENFFLDYGKQDRKEGEFVSALLIPKGVKPNLRCYKISKRFDQDISAVMLAANLGIRDGVIEGVRLAFGGMAGIPKCASHAEAALAGNPLDIAHFKKAGAALADDFTPMSDMRGSARYRLLTAQNLLVKYGLELISGKQMRLAGQGLAASLDGW